MNYDDEIEALKTEVAELDRFSLIGQITDDDEWEGLAKELLALGEDDGDEW